MIGSGLAEIGAALDRRELSSHELVAESLAAIAARPSLAAFLTVDPEGALAAAGEADRRRASGEEGPLLGVPIGVKDLHDTRGLRTTYGAVRFADHVPEADCIVVERLRAAGAVIVGKTNTPAFGLLGETKNRLGPDSRNPWDERLTTGGSSGGSAAAVAAGLVPVATGSDSAGSITAPSAMCGTVGIKPTLGRIPTWPTVDDSMLFFTNGPIATSVADAVTMLEAMAGHDERDPMACRDPLPDLRGALAAARRPAPLAGLAIAWSPDLGWFAVDGDVRDRAAALAAVTAELGASLVEASPAVEHPMELYLPIFGVDTRRGVLPLIDPAELFPESVAEIALYPQLSAEQFIGVLQRLFRFRAALAAFFERFDVLCTPATATTAFPVGEAPAPIGGRAVEPGWMTFMPFSVPWNLGTHPTVSIPAGLAGDGRPVGMMAVAPPGREDVLVRVAAALETARPWTYDTPRGGSS